MAYSAIITYPVYDLNSSLFIELIRDILQKEFLNQINTQGKSFRPTYSRNAGMNTPNAPQIADMHINP